VLVKTTAVSYKLQKLYYGNKFCWRKHQGLYKLGDSKNLNQNLIKAQNFLHLDNCNPKYELNTISRQFS